MASLDQFSEYEHLERILMDTVCADPIEYELTPDTEFERQRSEKYRRYQKEHYTPEHRLGVMGGQPRRKTAVGGLDVTIAVVNADDLHALILFHRLCCSFRCINPSFL